MPFIRVNFKRYFCEFRNELVDDVRIKGIGILEELRPFYLNLVILQTWMKGRELDFNDLINLRVDSYTGIGMQIRKEKLTSKNFTRKMNFKGRNVNPRSARSSILQMLGQLPSTSMTKR